jgi:3-dehydroquinate synthase
MINVKVELGENAYPIFIGSGSLAKLGEMLQLYAFSPQTMVISDSNIDKYHGAIMEETLKGYFETVSKIVLQPGEKSKSMLTLQRILTQMLEAGLDRKASVIAFGGGVVGDIAGFAASVYKRGIQYVQVPTTLLAQVDSSIGGKTGINHALGKNLIGTISQPRLVWSDLELLYSLPKREILCGLGEIVKYGIIRSPQLFDLLENNLEQILSLDKELLTDIVYECCRIKADVVADDEREMGVRMILNLGHTIGHALEAAMGYRKLSHGEGVLLGIIVESKIALDLGLLQPGDFKRITGLIDRLKITAKIQKIEPSEVLGYLQIDKKVAEGKVRFILPATVGATTVVDCVEEQVILSGLTYLNN